MKKETFFDKFNAEFQVNKRIHAFLIHCATQENCDASKAKLLFKCSGEKATVHLYEGSRHIKEFSVRAILEFFGHDYEEQHQASVKSYLVKTAEKEKITLNQVNVVICEVKNEMGAYVFDGSKYRTQISAIDLITHFLKKQDVPAK